MAKGALNIDATLAGLPTKQRTAKQGDALKIPYEKRYGQLRSGGMGHDQAWEVTRAQARINAARGNKY
jgi:hypothetical protein